MLKTRVITAAVLLLLIGCVMTVLPPVAGAITLIVVVAVGAWEWAAFAGCHTVAARTGYLAVTLLMGYLTADVLHTPNVYQLMWVAVAWWIVATARIVLAQERVSSGMTLVAGWMTLLPAVIAVALLYTGSPTRGEGNARFLMLLALVSSADIGAYFAGRRFGRHKLAPKVSPGKTWEGVAGGAVAVSLVAWLITQYWGWSAGQFVLVATLVFAASIVGDLTESLFKRGAGLKDSGVILPGHGGILDRIDSLTAAAPLYVLGLHWMGLLS